MAGQKDRTALAIFRLTAHFSAMGTGPESTRTKIGTLGRSAATRRYVLRPASKAGSISVRDAKSAATQVADHKKK